MSVAVIVVSLLSIDFLIGKIGDYAMEIMPDYSGQVAKNNFRLNRVSTDVVIIGSSRGAHHYVTTMLCDSINNYTGKNYSAYNAAIDGNFINSNSCAAESILDRYAPKLLIFEVSEWELAGGQAEKDMEFAAVNYNNNRIVKRYIDDLGWKEKVKVSSNMFRYNQMLLRIASSFFKKGDESGYEPLYQKMTIIPEKQSSNNSHTIDDYSLTNFERVLKTAKDKGVLMVVVSSPCFDPTDNNLFLKELCEKYDTPYIDCYNIDSFNQHPEYFKDNIHLNDEGAHIYTSLFFEQIKPLIKT